MSVTSACSLRGRGFTLHLFQASQSTITVGAFPRREVANREAQVGQREGARCVPEEQDQSDVRQRTCERDKQILRRCSRFTHYIYTLHAKANAFHFDPDN